MLSALKSLFSSTAPHFQCRWCRGPKGLADECPLPVCDKCRELALRNNAPGSPRGNLWEKLCEQFPREMEAWVAQMRNPRAPDFDLRDAIDEANREIMRLDREEIAAIRANDTKRAEELREQSDALRRQVDNAKTDARAL